VPVKDVGTVKLNAPFTGADMPAARKTTLTAVGIQTQTWARTEFRKKARGATDVWGILWAPLTLFAIAARLLKRAAGRAILKMLPRGSGKQKARGAILAMAIDGYGPPLVNGPTKASLARDAKLAKFASAVREEKKEAEIGVDSGRMVNALQFGRPDSIFHVEAQAVTIGVGVGYGPRFDAHRKIMPDTLTPGQTEQLETIAVKAYEATLKKGLGK
jgi:hypothetical protein